MTSAPQAAQSAEGVSPPWGAFPAEQYLIVSRKNMFVGVYSRLIWYMAQRYWDYSFPHSPDTQRQSLIRSFLKLDAIPKRWDTTGRESPQWLAMERAPTDDEIRLILVPWRSLRLRDAALHIWRDRFDEAIWCERTTTTTTRNLHNGERSTKIMTLTPLKETMCYGV